MAFAKIRGPIGGSRQDMYALMHAWFASGPHEEEMSAADFLPWIENEKR